MSLTRELQKFIAAINIKKVVINKINKNDKTILIYRTDLIGDYLMSRNFLELIRKSKKFQNYKIVVLLNIAVKDLALKFDSKYADEFIFYDIKQTNSLVLKLLKDRLNKYHFEYLINYHTLRQLAAEEIAKVVEAKNKFALKNFAQQFSKNEEDEFNKNYTEIFSTNDNYALGAVQFANLITGEQYKEQYTTCSLNINENNFPNNKNLNLNYPYVILFPSASYKEKRMDFEYFLDVAEYIHKHIKEKTGKEIKCVIIGSKQDKELFKGYNLNKSYLVNLCGKYKLSDLPYIFHKALLVITNETCAVHFAYAANLKNALVFCNVYPPTAETIEYFKNKKEGDAFLFGKPNMCNYYYLYPKISIEKAMDESYVPSENEDLRIKQDLKGISKRHIYAALDNIINDIIN